jgi:PIN domain nuclease of toxin-antitoxin system
VDLLLDTHVLLWWLADSSRLSEPARAAIADPNNRVLVSAATGWEIAIKLGLGKLAVQSDAADWLPAELTANRFSTLPIDLRHALAVERLPLYHTDPFDRLLIGQAALEGLTIMTADRQFEPYGPRLILC